MSSSKQRWTANWCSVNIFLLEGRGALQDNIQVYFNFSYLHPIGALLKEQCLGKDVGAVAVLLFQEVDNCDQLKEMHIRTCSDVHAGYYGRRGTT